MGKEDHSIIPNVLLPEIPLLETVLQLRNENLTKTILEKKDFDFPQMVKALRETNNKSKIKFKKNDKVKVARLFFLPYSFS